MNHLLILSSVVAFAAMAFAGCSAVRSGYESAPYRVVRSEGAFEVRDYQPLALAETRMGDGANGGFGRLFGYITGANAERTHIPMTTPVLMEHGRMAFVMPEGRPMSALPKPSDSGVKVVMRDAGRFAVLRYRGGRSQANEERAERTLRSRMDADGLHAQSDPVFGYFDPPWTPPFLRRNEVMIRIDPSAS